MIGAAGLAMARERECVVVADALVPADGDVSLRDGACGVPAPVGDVACRAHCAGGSERRIRSVPEETPVAFSFNGSSYAVMMATPADLADFALGFSLAEGVIDRPAEIESLDVVPHATGLELRMWLAPARASALAERRRRLTGPTGCGLCGVESLAALPAAHPVSAGIEVTPRLVASALPLLVGKQALNATTGAMHAAGFFVPGQGFVSVREDVGRHNALDKLIGDLAGRAIAGPTGFVVLTSRVSVELVHKTAVLGASIMVAISAPTALAIRTAEQAGITLVAMARDDGFEIFTHPRRVRADRM